MIISFAFVVAFAFFFDVVDVDVVGNDANARNWNQFCPLQKSALETEESVCQRPFFPEKTNLFLKKKYLSMYFNLLFDWFGIDQSS